MSLLCAERAWVDTSKSEAKRIDAQLVRNADGARGILPAATKPAVRSPPALGGRASGGHLPRVHNASVRRAWHTAGVREARRCAEHTLDEASRAQCPGVALLRTRRATRLTPASKLPPTESGLEQS